MEKVIAGQNVNVNEEGYLTDMNQWNEDIARELAKENGIELTPKHFDVIHFLRDQQKKDVTLSIRGVGKSGVVDIKTFYDLFPKGPLKLASKIAGIPKPHSCV